MLDLYFGGDAKAFELFFERHSRRVLAYGMSKGLSREDALDLTQDVFLKLHRSIHLYEKGRPALPWFFTLVHRMFIDCVRKIKVHNGRYVEHDIESFNAASVTSTADQSSIAEQADNLKGLPADHRQIIELRIIKELSFKEISTLLGKSEVASRKLFERALKKLRKTSRKEG